MCEYYFVDQAGQTKCPNGVIEVTTLIDKKIQCPHHHEKRMKDLQALWDDEWKTLEEAHTGPGYRVLAKNSKAYGSIDRDNAFAAYRAQTENKNKEFYETARAWQADSVVKARKALEDEWQQTQAELAGPPVIQPWQDDWGQTQTEEYRYDPDTEYQ
jgi:hypothetical protein